jgi:hypothetical protein
MLAQNTPAFINSEKYLGPKKGKKMKKPPMKKPAAKKPMKKGKMYGK